MAHKFKVGQRVHLTGSGVNRQAAGVYKVVARMPEERGDPQYRVENSAGTQQRVAWESELTGLESS